MSDEVLEKVVARLREYLESDNSLRTFHVSLHGGEPTLIGKYRFSKLCAALLDVGAKLGKKIDISCQTNATLIDDEWVSILRFFNVSTGVSIDGPKTVHDRYRVSKSGRGSFDDCLRGFEKLRAGGLDPSILAVWTEFSDPDELVDFFVETLQVKWFDVLFPDGTQDSTPANFAGFYLKLYDLWFDELDPRGVEVRICKALTRSVLGLKSGMESIGITEVKTASINTAGRYELLDVLNIAGNRLAYTPHSIFNCSIHDFSKSKHYQRQLDQSKELCNVCRTCRFEAECGGGYFPSRWSKTNGFDNPSVHCKSLFAIYSHVEKRLLGRLQSLKS